MKEARIWSTRSEERRAPRFGMCPLKSRMPRTSTDTTCASISLGRPALRRSGPRRARARCWSELILSVGEAGDVVGEVLLAAGNALVIDRETSCHAFVSTMRRRPDPRRSCVTGRRSCRASGGRKGGEANAGERGEDASGPTLGAFGVLAACGLLVGVVGAAAVFGFGVSSAAGFSACRLFGHEHGAFQGDLAHR